MLEASSLLYSKGVSPRQIFDVINHTITKNGVEFGEQHILQSCQSFRTNGDPNSGAFSSLSAINLTAFDDYFLGLTTLQNIISLGIWMELWIRRQEK